MSPRTSKRAKPAILVANPIEVVVALAPVETYVPTSKPDGTPYSGDKFTIRKELHGITYVGDDGYVVPRNFGEFETQEPRYIQRWVQKKIHHNMIDDDVLDWASDLSMHMRYLPESSIGRLEGYNEANPLGCTDLIQCFNPYNCFGASKRRFLFYVNRCLANRFSTIHSKNQKNPIMRDGNLVYDPTATAEEAAKQPGIGGEEYIHQNSGHQRERLHNEAVNAEQVMFLNAFRVYLCENEPTLVPMIAAIGMGETQEDSQHILGITPQMFHHNKKRLKILGECFKNGDPIPVWRKYKRHAKVGTLDVATAEVAVEAA